MKPPDDLCILIPVWPGYWWVVPLTLALLDRHWPHRPPVFLLGLSPTEAGPQPHFPLTQPELRGNWTATLRDGVRQARRHFRRAYLVLEEHAPLAPCQEDHLHGTLPDFLDRRGGVYLSLMGWDNRRYSSRNPVLGRADHHIMHLTRPRAPRFHLHPALWDLAALEGCCDVALRSSVSGSAWAFEKTLEKPSVDLPPAWKSGCYQIAAHALRARFRGLSFAAARAERWLFNRLTAPLPWFVGSRGFDAYTRLLRLDDVFCPGPYPMIFSGLLAKGRLNPHLAGRLHRSSADRALLAEIAAAESTQRALPRAVVSKAESCFSS